MSIQLSVCARTGRSQFETGCGPRVAAEAGALATRDAMPTAEVATATIAPIRRLFFIRISSSARRCRPLARPTKRTLLETQTVLRDNPGVSYFVILFCTKCLVRSYRKDDVARKPWTNPRFRSSGAVY